MVHAHPEKQSFCSALKDAAINHFQNKGAEVKVSDLYKMGFNPVGDKNDFLELSNPDFFKYQAEQTNAFQKIYSHLK
ncbi:MAG: NAD(P)H-dependent oxidoreductase [Crocinitomicaceae bacterium]|nr:NAD(P)H-dependent oxidoreductase [Crocinitomicaceae bacterium]